MRKLTATAPAHVLLPPSSSPSPSPAPSPSPYPFNDYNDNDSLFFLTAPFDESGFDIVTLGLISCLVLLSLVSLSFIILLRLKSRRAHHLNNFNSFWSVRLLLVSFVAVWAYNEIYRLPFFHHHYLKRFLPSLNSSQKGNLCKLHVVLSLGLFEPGFLITLLFLLNMSIKKSNSRGRWGTAWICLACLPLLLIQAVVVFFSPLKAYLPAVFETSSVVSIDKSMLMCKYPLFSTMIFAAFGFVYSLIFLFSYWRVASLVINKGTRFRIHVLALSVLVSLPMQVFFLAFSSFWRPESSAYVGVVFAMFICAWFCAAAGEGILVIKPTADALAAGEDSCRPRLNTDVQLQRVEIGRTQDVASGGGGR